MRRPRRDEGGFTIIELLLGLAISSLLVGMVFAIVIRMSAAYRTQQQVSEIQQTLGAALALIRQDAKAAGLGMPNGFALPLAGRPASTGRPDAVSYFAPVQVINGGTSGPDTLGLFWADTTRAARVKTGDGFEDPAGVAIGVGGAPLGSAVVDANDLAVNDVVVLSSLRLVPTSEPAVPGEPDVATYRTCVVQIASKTALGGVPPLERITFGATLPWGDAGQPHCIDVVRQHAQMGGGAVTMVYPFQMRAYRVDTTAVGSPAVPRNVLQRSVTGGIQADWQDIGVGFADLQVVLRMYEGWADMDNDAHTDPNLTAVPPITATSVLDDLSATGDEYVWIANVDNLPAGKDAGGSAFYEDWSYTIDPLNRFGPFDAVVEAMVTVVVQTTKTIDGVGSTSTPDLTQPISANGPPRGDRVPLTGLPGNSIYRHATALIDFRNIGAGR